MIDALKRYLMDATLPSTLQSTVLSLFKQIVVLYTNTESHQTKQPAHHHPLILAILQEDDNKNFLEQVVSSTTSSDKQAYQILHNNVLKLKQSTKKENTVA